MAGSVSWPRLCPALLLPFQSVAAGVGTLQALHPGCFIIQQCNRGVSVTRPLNQFRIILPAPLSNRQVGNFVMSKQYHGSFTPGSGHTGGEYKSQPIPLTGLLDSQVVHCYSIQEDAAAFSRRMFSCSSISACRCFVSL